MGNVINHKQESTTLNQRLYTVPTPEALLSFLQQGNQPPDEVIQRALNTDTNTDTSAMKQRGRIQAVPWLNTTIH